MKKILLNEEIDKYDIKLGAYRWENHHKEISGCEIVVIWKVTTWPNISYNNGAVTVAYENLICNEVLSMEPEQIANRTYDCDDNYSFEEMLEIFEGVFKTNPRDRDGDIIEWIPVVYDESMFMWVHK